VQELAADITFMGPDEYTVAVEGATHAVTATLSAPQLELVIDGVSATATACLFRNAAQLHRDMWLGARQCHFVWPEHAWEAFAFAGPTHGRLVSPMTAKVSKVCTT
jgi:hypothetical protein